jgi:hypothetical protein
MKLSELEDGHLVATKEDLREVRLELANFRVEFYKEFGNFKADLLKTFWLSQLSMAGIIVALVGLLNGGTFFLISQMIARIPHTP